MIHTHATIAPIIVIIITCVASTIRAESALTSQVIECLQQSLVFVHVLEPVCQLLVVEQIGHEQLKLVLEAHEQHHEVMLASQLRRAYARVDEVLLIDGTGVPVHLLEHGHVGLFGQREDVLLRELRLQQQRYHRLTLVTLEWTLCQVVAHGLLDERPERGVLSVGERK